MITKIINSYDIHINGQLLRVVEAGELLADAGSFNSKNLLLNEPRGNKYVNLVVYRINCDAHTLEATLDSSDEVINKDILLKAFINSLTDRKKIEESDLYTLHLDGETLTYKNDELKSLLLFDVISNNGSYSVNNKDIQKVETELTLEVNNLTEIKLFIEEIECTSDYLVLYNQGKFITVNQEKTVIPYPIIEVVSLLNEEYKGDTLTSFTGKNIDIKSNLYTYQYYLISNSQFYIDDTDIYERGFIIK